jgi:hypothetical protein
MHVYQTMRAELLLPIEKREGFLPLALHHEKHTYRNRTTRPNNLYISTLNNPDKPLENTTPHNTDTSPSSGTTRDHGSTAVLPWSLSFPPVKRPGTPAQGFVRSTAPFVLCLVSGPAAGLLAL